MRNLLENANPINGWIALNQEQAEKLKRAAEALELIRESAKPSRFKAFPSLTIYEVPAAAIEAVNAALA